MCVSQSRFFYEAVSESQFFARLRVSTSQFVPLTIFINYVLSLRDMEFQWSNLQIFWDFSFLPHSKLFAKRIQWSIKELVTIWSTGHATRSQSVLTTQDMKLKFKCNSLSGFYSCLFPLIDWNSFLFHSILSVAKNKGVISSVIWHH